MFYLIAICALLGLLLVYTGWRESRNDTNSLSTLRLAKLNERGKGPSEDAKRLEEEREFMEREEERAAAEAKKRARANDSYLPSVARIVTKHTLLSRLELDLMQVKSRYRASELITFSITLALLVLVALAYIGVPIELGFLASVAWLGLPWGYVKLLRAAYYRKFDEQLADSLMLMSNGLRAGFSFLQALEMVARESRPPIADEFNRITQEIAVGVPIAQALSNLSARINSMDLQLMVTAIIIQREIGGGLAEMLETIAGTIRQRLSIKREVRVLTTQGRATGAILGFLPLSLGLAIHLIGKMSDPFGPSFVQPLFDTDFGRNLLFACLVLQCIGFGVIMKIVSIKV